MSSYSNADVVMNFRIPKGLKNEFQIICDNYHVSMSGRLNDFVRNYVKEIKSIDTDNTQMKKVSREKEWVKSKFGSWRDELVKGYYD